MRRIMTLLLTLSSFFVNGQNKFYKETDLLLPEGTKSLYGVLTTPQTRDSLNVLAIIVAGSGATDKDGNQYEVMFPNTYKFLAHGLAQKGISTFRFDKRGVGASAFTGVQIVWEKTHLFTSRYWTSFAMAALLIFPTIAQDYSNFFLITFFILLFIPPIVYSYNISRKNK